MKNYLLLKNGCRRLAKYGINIGKIPIIRAEVDLFKVNIEHFNENLKSPKLENSFIKKENISYLKENIIPLEKILWWHNDVEGKFKILEIDDNFISQVFCYFKDIKYSLGKFNYDLLNFEGYYYRGEKIVL